MAKNNLTTSEIIDNFIEKILNEDYVSVMSSRFSRYTKIVALDRAIPDVRDGLKPVQRRILYAMNNMGLTHNSAYKKCARITGDVMGKYHPHGDSSIYEALVHLSQDFKMNTPLVDMHGNNGSIDGDPAAAFRYTEARLSLASEYLLDNIDSNTVRFIPNFDDTEKEPIVLPARYPNLLVNGSRGIAVGLATEIPPHNLGEVIDGTIALIDNPYLTNNQLFEIILGPDFPTGGIVGPRSEIFKALSSGEGKILIRSKVDIEVEENLKHLIVTEVPFDVNKAELCKAIDELRISKKCEDILEVRDETDASGIRIVIDLKSSSDANVILNYLYKTTKLQNNLSYNLVSIIDNKPMKTGFMEVLSAYIDHQKDIYTNKLNFDLEKAKRKMHINEGLVKIASDTSILDEVIRIIRYEAKGKADSKLRIMNRFGLDDLQAEAIVTLQLYRLSNTDIRLIIEEQTQLAKNVKDIESILGSDKKLLKLIKEELIKAKEALHQARRSQIVDSFETIKINKQDLITKEEAFIGITNDGYIKRSTIKNYNSSKEQGLKDGDYYIFTKACLTTEFLLIITNFGNYMNIPVYRLDDQKWSNLGNFIGNIVDIEKDEKIISVHKITSFLEKQRVLLATNFAYVKQINLSEFETQKNKTYKAIKLSPGELVVSSEIGYNTNIIGLTKIGYGIRLDETSVELSSTGTKGSRVLNLREKDIFKGAFYSDAFSEIVILTSRGHIIKAKTDDYHIVQRLKSGFLLIEKLKTNPHYVESFFNLTKNQAKEVKGITLRSKNITLNLNTNDLKYNQNKYGKEIIGLSPSNPLYTFTIEKSEFDIIEAPTTNVDQPTLFDYLDQEPVNKQQVEEPVSFEITKAKDLVSGSKKDSLKESLPTTKKPKLTPEKISEEEKPTKKIEIKPISRLDLDDDF